MKVLNQRTLAGVGAVLAAASIAGCGSDGAPLAVPKVPRLSIESARTPNEPATVWAVGDGADGSAPAKELARRISRDRPDRFLYLGDVYDAGAPGDFRKNYTPLYGHLAGVTAPTPGNHEWPSRVQGYNRYFAGSDGAPPPAWYRFRIGGWQMLSLNSEAPHAPGSPQLRWLTRTLRSSPSRCTVAFFHRPFASAGIHGDQADMGSVWQALRGHAELVLNGHDHDLQRFRPRDGMTELVIGAGGEDLYPINRHDPRLRFANDSQQGALKMTLRPGKATLAIISSRGKILDRSSVSC